MIRFGNHACILQQRDLLDVILLIPANSPAGRYLREKVANLIIGISGKFTFICVTDKSADPEFLSGQIFMIANCDARAELKNIKPIFSTDFEDNKGFEALQSELREKCAGYAEQTANFRLARNGKLKLAFDFSANEYIEQPTLCQIVADQFYYFFKDIAHVHQHHEPNHDALIRLSEITLETQNDWIIDTQHALYRAVIRSKRFRNEKTLFRASGILAYAKSFEKAFAGESKDLHAFHNDELEESLAISRQEIQHFDQKKLARVETVRNFFFALFGLIISATFLVRLKPDIAIEPHYLLIAFTSFIAAKPFHIVGLVFGLSWFYSYVAHYRDPANIGFVRVVLRWAQGFRQRSYYIANLIITVAFTVAAYFLLTY